MSKVFQVNQTIDKMVKDRFLTIYNSAQKSAEKKYKTSIKSALKELSNFDKIKFLKTEKNKLDLIKNDVKVAAFLSNSTTEEWLLKSYASRYTILNIDESKELEKAVYHGRLSQLISDELFQIRNLIPPYSYDDFIAGKEDPIFTDLDYSSHFIDRQDIDKIRLWQANKIVLMLSFETSMIINYTQTKLEKNPDALTILSNDLEHYESKIKEQSFDTPEKMIDSLKALSFLSGYDFELINNDLALEDFHTFFELDLSWNRVTPKYIERSRVLLDEAGKVKPFSQSPIIFYTIAQVIQWIEKVVNGQLLMEPFIYPDYDAIVEETLQVAEQKADKTIEDFEDTMDIHNLSKQEAESHYIDGLEGIRHEFNDLVDYEKQYFASIHRDDVKQVFQINAIFFDFEEHKKALEKAANLYHRLINFYSCCRIFTGSQRINYPNSEDEFSPHELNFLASTMVLDNDLHIRLSKLYKNVISDILRYGLPVDIAYQSLKEEAHEIFQACVENLLAYLEDCEPGNKVMYIQSRLKDLRQRELKNRALSLRYRENPEIGYTTMLKEYLELEAEFISSTKDIQFISALNVPKIKKVLPLLKTMSFGYKQKDSTKLLSFITSLNLKIDLLNQQKTSPNDLMVVLTVNDLSKELPSIYFNCETTQLSYIFDKLRPYFKNLTLKNIEESQLFFTKKGTHLKAQNLSASRIDNPKEQEEIDRAFSLLQ